MQNPKIKLFYILTVKTIKDIYIMNEQSGVDCLLRCRRMCVFCIGFSQI